MTTEPGKPLRGVRPTPLLDPLGAVYVDLEGTTDGDVAILGIGYFEASEWMLEQIVVDERLHRYAQYSCAKGLGVHAATLREGMLRLQQLTSERGGSLVGFTSHEATVLPVLAQSVAVRLDINYIDAHKRAKAWARAAFPDKKPVRVSLRKPGSGYSIHWFAGLLGIPIPPSHGPGHTGNRLRELRASETTTQRMTSVRKGKWTNLLEHNRWDIEVMRDLIRAMS